MKHLVYGILSFSLVFLMIVGNIRVFVKAQENPSSVLIPGDLNNDERVNLKDLVILALAFKNYNSIADIDGNGYVNQIDVRILSEFYAHGIPQILSFSTDLPRDERLLSGIMTVKITVEHAERCVLSYTILYVPGPAPDLSPNFNGTNWINETMTRNGDTFTATISTVWMPSQGNTDAPSTTVYFKAIAYDSLGYSNQTATFPIYLYPHH